MYLSNICYIIKQKKKRGILMIFKWMNESAISIEGDRIEITAPPKTDFFVEVLMNVKTVFYRNHFVMPHTIIPKSRETLSLK